MHAFDKYIGLQETLLHLGLHAVHPPYVELRTREYTLPQEPQDEDDFVEAKSPLDYYSQPATPSSGGSCVSSVLRSQRRKRSLASDNLQKAVATYFKNKSKRKNNADLDFARYSRFRTRQNEEVQTENPPTH